MYIFQKPTPQYGNVQTVEYRCVQKARQAGKSRQVAGESRKYAYYRYCRKRDRQASDSGRQIKARQIKAWQIKAGCRSHDLHLGFCGVVGCLYVHTYIRLYICTCISACVRTYIHTHMRVHHLLIYTQNKANR